MEKENKAVVENPEEVVKIKKIQKAGEYPYGLDEKAVIKLIKIAGAIEIAKRTKEIKEDETIRDYINRTPKLRRMAIEVLKKSGIKVGKRIFLEGKESTLLLTMFRTTLVFIEKRPAFLTEKINRTLKKWGFEEYTRKFVWIYDVKNDVMVPRLAKSSITGRKEQPLGNLELLHFQLEEAIYDKIKLIVDSIKPSEIKKATLGQKSKSIRDLYTVVHMMKNKPRPNLTLVNLNLTTADPSEKLKAVQVYVSQNQDKK